MSEQLDLMIKHLLEENEQLYQQRMTAIRSTAQQLEHEDTAPHEGCACKLCVALAEVERLREELGNTTQDAEIFQCDVASALGWGRYPENGMKAGERFDVAIRRLRAENASIEEMNESLRNQNLSLIATNEKNEAESEQLKQRVAELEPFQPGKWALVEGKPSYDDLADQHAKAVQLVGDQQKKIADLEEKRNTLQKRSYLLSAMRLVVRKLARGETDLKWTATQRPMINDTGIAGVAADPEVIDDVRRLQKRIAELEARHVRVTRNSLTGWLVVEECDDGSLILENTSGDRRHVWKPELEAQK